MTFIRLRHFSRRHAMTTTPRLLLLRLEVEITYSSSPFVGPFAMRHVLLPTRSTRCLCQVPLDDETEETMQQWLDMLDDLAFAGCTHTQYFDLGQEIVTSALLGGAAWLPMAPPQPRGSSDSQLVERSLTL